MTLHIFNMKGPLLLSTPNEKTICVDAKIVKNLTSYHVDGIRFLYQQCICKGGNIVLNNEEGMNEERQICAFLTAVERTKPSLIVCEPRNLSKWYYEFSQAGLQVITANELVSDESWEESGFPDAVLVLHDQLRHVKALPINDWFLYIVQHLEKLQKSRHINNISSEYKIAIINQNYVDVTLEFQWFVVKWTNSLATKDKELYLSNNNSLKMNFVWPFPEYWRRITWKSIEKFKPTQQESEEYEDIIKVWCEENKPSLLNETVKTNKTRTAARKRTSTRLTIKNNKNSKRSRPISKYVMNLINSSESEEEISDRSNKTSNSSDTQDTGEENITQTPINDIKINISKRTFSIKTKCSESVPNESTDSNILDSLIEHSKPSTSKNLARSIKPQPSSIQMSSNNEENILNSLIDSPVSSPKKAEKDFGIPDTENDTCPILDLLFS